MQNSIENILMMLIIAGFFIGWGSVILQVLQLDRNKDSGLTRTQKSAKVADKLAPGTIIFCISFVILSAWVFIFPTKIESRYLGQRNLIEIVGLPALLLLILYLFMYMHGKNAGTEKTQETKSKQ